MLFNSYIFILLFLPLTLFGYFTLNRFHKFDLAKIYLALMSFWFYGYFNPSYIIIILISIIFNYILGNHLIKCIKQTICKCLLTLGICINLGLLFYFKYFDFFISNVNTVFSSDYNLMNIALPLGISFFTFQQLSYIIDCSKKFVPKYNLLDYSLFVSFFPQLVAGPIVLHSEIVPQFADIKNKSFDYDNFAKGIYSLSIGLAKKVLLADTFAYFTNWGYANISNMSSTDAIFVMLSFTIQIYFDFNGYCDIATGVGYMFNIKIPSNFNSPYKSCSILEFWKTWHITLTRFFTNYIYIPLGGNKKGKLNTYKNIFIVFLLSGIWHGANWTFIVWGLLHGLANIFTQILKKHIIKIPKFINWIITFIFINLTWVIFRAESLSQSVLYFKNIFTFNFSKISMSLICSAEDVVEYGLLNNIGNYNRGLLLFLSVFVLALFIIFFTKNTSEKLKTFKPSYSKLIFSLVLLTWCVVSFSGYSAFLYFDF